MHHKKIKMAFDNPDIENQIDPDDPCYFDDEEEVSESMCDLIIGGMIILILGVVAILYFTNTWPFDPSKEELKAPESSPVSGIVASDPMGAHSQDPEVGLKTETLGDPEDPHTSGQTGTSGDQTPQKTQEEQEGGCGMTAPIIGSALVATAVGGYVANEYGPTKGYLDGTLNRIKSYLPGRLARAQAIAEAAPPAGEGHPGAKDPTKTGQKGKAKEPTKAGQKDSPVVDPSTKQLEKTNPPAQEQKPSEKKISAVPEKVAQKQVDQKIPPKTGEVLPQPEGIIGLAKYGVKTTAELLDKGLDGVEAVTGMKDRTIANHVPKVDTSSFRPAKFIATGLGVAAVSYVGYKIYCGGYEFINQMRMTIFGKTEADVKAIEEATIARLEKNAQIEHNAGTALSTVRKELVDDRLYKKLSDELKPLLKELERKKEILNKIVRPVSLPVPEPDTRSPEEKKLDDDGYKTKVDAYKAAVDAAREAVKEVENKIAEKDREMDKVHPNWYFRGLKWVERGIEHSWKPVCYGIIAWLAVVYMLMPGAAYLSPKMLPVKTFFGNHLGAKAMSGYILWVWGGLSAAFTFIGGYLGTGCSKIWSSRTCWTCGLL